MKKWVFLIIAMAPLSCTNSIDTKFIKSNLWTYQEGFKVGQGDAISFDLKPEIFTIREDTLYYMGNPKAIIKKIFNSGYSMKLTSLDQKEVGVYRNVAESLR